MTTVKCRRGQISGLSCYTAGCREPECRKARIRHAARYRAMRRANGGPLSVPVQEVQPIIRALLAGGWTRRGIADAVGLRERTIGELAACHPPTRSVQHATVQLLRRLNPQTPQRFYVDATGPRLRLQALAVLGWTLAELQRRSGLRDRTLSRIRSGRAQRVERPTADRITAIYEQLWDKRPAPSQAVTTTRNLAHASGWVPPMGLDDEELVAA